MEKVKTEMAQLNIEPEGFLNEYNKELDEAEAEIDAGNYLTHDEVKQYFVDKRKRISGN